MKLTLIRTYKNGDVVNIFSTSLENMDEFIIGFKNKEDLELYFSEMKKNVLDDGQIDFGEFKLIGRSKKDTEFKELPMLFGEDFESLKEDLRKDLLRDDDFVRDLMCSKPELFEGSLEERMNISLNGNTPATIHQRNIRTLENSLLNGKLKSNFRAIYNIASSYIGEDKVKKVKVLQNN